MVAIAELISHPDKSRYSLGCSFGALVFPNHFKYNDILTAGPEPEKNVLHELSRAIDKSFTDDRKRREGYPSKKGQ